MSIDTKPDYNDIAMLRLGSRLSVAASELHRAIKNGHANDRHGTLLIAGRLEQIALGIAAKCESASLHQIPAA